MKKLVAIIKKYPFIFIGLSLLVFFTVILVITAISMRTSVEVELLVAPASATTTIDGKEYKNGALRLEPGEHRVHIEKDGFVTQDFSFSTLSTTKIYTYLRQSDGLFTWYQSHPEDSLLLTKIGDYLSDQEASVYSKQNPVIQALPIIYANYDENYNYTEFRIDGGKFDGCKSDFCLKVTDSTGGNFNFAKTKIKEAGYNPDDFQILYEYKPVRTL